jgi:hypothetical protein
VGYDNWVMRYAHLSETQTYSRETGYIEASALESPEIAGDVDEPYLHVDLMNLKRQWMPIPLVG